MRGRRRHKPNDEWVMPRTEDLARQERPPPPTGPHPLPPEPSRPTPELPPPLPEISILPEVQNPHTGGAPSGENRGEEGITADGRQETPPVENNNPLVSTPPPSPATPPSPASTTSTSPLLERGQRTRRPPAYLQDFVCDRITSGRYESPAGRRTERLAAKRGSYEHHGKTKFCENGIASGITTLRAHISGLAQQTRCPVFSYADAVKSRRAF